MKTIRIILAGLACALLPLAAAHGTNRQVGPGSLVISNTLSVRVAVSFSEDRTHWTVIVFEPHSAPEIPYRKYVRIETVKEAKALAPYEDDLSPAGKYAIVLDESGRRVLRKKTD